MDDFGIMKANWYEAAFPEHEKALTIGQGLILRSTKLPGVSWFISSGWRAWSG